MKGKGANAGLIQGCSKNKLAVISLQLRHTRLKAICRTEVVVRTSGLDVQRPAFKDGKDRGAVLKTCLDLHAERAKALARREQAPVPTMNLIYSNQGYCWISPAFRLTSWAFAMACPVSATAARRAVNSFFFIEDIEKASSCAYEE